MKNASLRRGWESLTASSKLAFNQVSLVVMALPSYSLMFKEQQGTWGNTIFDQVMALWKVTELGASRQKSLIIEAAVRLMFLSKDVGLKIIARFPEGWIQ